MKTIHSLSDTNTAVIALNIYMGAFHSHWDAKSKEMDLCFHTKGYISPSFIGIKMVQNSTTKDSDTHSSDVSFLSDEELLDTFEDFSTEGKNKKHTKDLTFWKERIHHSDVKGFVSNGWCFVKERTPERLTSEHTQEDIIEIDTAIEKSYTEKREPKKSLISLNKGVDIKATNLSLMKNFLIVIDEKGYSHRERVVGAYKMITTLKCITKDVVFDEDIQKRHGMGLSPELFRLQTLFGEVAKEIAFNETLYDLTLRRVFISCSLIALYIEDEM